MAYTFDWNSYTFIIYPKEGLQDCHEARPLQVHGMLCVGPKPSWNFRLDLCIFLHSKFAGCRVTAKKDEGV